MMVTKAVLFASVSCGVRPAGAAEPSLGLLPIANQPLLLHALDSLEEAGVDRVAVMVPDCLLREVEWTIAQREPNALTVDCLVTPAAGLASSLRAAEDFIAGDRFVLHLGDSFGRDPLRPLVADAGKGDSDALVFIRGDAPTRQRDSGTVVPLGRPEWRLNGNGAAWASKDFVGLCVLGAGVLDRAEEFGDGGTLDVELAAALRCMKNSGGHVETRAVHDWWRYRAMPDAMLEANRFALEGLSRRTDGVSVVDSLIQAAVRIDPTARIESTLIRGPAVIGPNVVLRDAYVGPYTSVGADVRVEGAEVENSILLPGCSLSNLASRLESSIVGPGARVFSDFRLPRAVRMTVGDGAVVALT